MSRQGNHWRVKISDEHWEEGWRRTLEEAIDTFLADRDLDEPVEVKIQVKKRSDNPIHDYLVGP